MSRLYDQGGTSLIINSFLIIIIIIIIIFIIVIFIAIANKPSQSTRWPLRQTNAVLPDTVTFTVEQGDAL